MLTLGLSKGCLHHIEPGGSEITNWFSSTTLPIGCYSYDAEVIKALPPISVYYDVLVKLGYQGERIIEELLRTYHQFRCFRVGHLKDKQLTIGFIGKRGSGKSAGAALITNIDYLLCGKRVWSDMPIEVKVTYKDASKEFKSEPIPRLDLLNLDDDFRDGVIVTDEVNLNYMESSRYSSGTNLAFGNFLQQIRHRNISCIWTAQNWNTLDSRLKWQSDFIVWCVDAFLEHEEGVSEMGEYSRWRVMDSSGMTGAQDFEEQVKQRYLLESMVWTGSVYIRPWWAAYPTGKLQGKETYSKRLLQKEVDNSVGFKVGGSLAASRDPADALVRECLQTGTLQVDCDSIWKANNLENNRSAQTKIGSAFKREGYAKKRWPSGKYYWKRCENGGTDAS